MSRQMKDSGIDWIREIPSEWKIQKVKYLFDSGKGLSITKENLIEDGLPVISYGQIHSKTNTGVNIHNGLLRYVDFEYQKQYPKCEVKKYDFIFADTSEDYEGCGNCVYKRDDSILFAGYHSIILHSIHQQDNRYFAYLFKTDCWRKQLRQVAFGVKVFSIAQKTLINSSLLIPSYNEQQKIANFLDDKVGEIDKVISKTTKTIEDYKKYKQALITETITKGLNDNVEMKESKDTYLGKIPKHWNEKRLRYLGFCQNGISKSSEYFGKGYPFVSYSDVYKNYSLPDNGSGLIESNDNDRDIYSVKYGDVFFTRTSETIEEVGFASTCLKTIENATFAGFVIRFRPNNQEELLPQYSKYYFRSDIHRKFFVKEMNLVTRASLSQELLKKLPVLLPPLNEQREIAEYLDKKCNEVDKLIDIKEQLVLELESYKKSIIYEYVTGKKEVI